MKEREQRLQELIAAVQQQPRQSLKWRKALNQLILEIQQLPGLVKSSHPDYYEALDDTLMRLADEILDFEPQHSSLTQSLVAWVNGKLRLKYAVRELHSPSHRRVRSKHPTAKSEFKQQARQTPLSLDTPLGDDRGETFATQLRAPSLWEARSQIEREQQRQKNLSIGVKLQRYIEQDPDSLLRNCHPKAHPGCNCHVLSLRLLLKVPPDKLVAVAKELEVNYHTLNWHWKNKGLPLLRAIALDFGYQPPAEDAQK